MAIWRRQAASAVVVNLELLDIPDAVSVFIYVPVFVESFRHFQFTCDNSYYTIKNQLE